MAEKTPASKPRKTAEMSVEFKLMKHTTWLRLLLTVILLQSMLSACSDNFLLTSAQEATGGVGAGLSGVQ